MSAMPTAEPLINLMRYAEIIPSAWLDDFLKGQSANLQPGALLDKLVRSKLLTPFQAEQLANGRLQELEVGPYRILDQLGGGATGSVYLAERKDDKGTKVAVKVLGAKFAEMDQTAVPRLQREARVGAALSHPNIIRVLDVGTADGRHFLVMEYVDGCNFDELVQKKGIPSISDAVNLIIQAAQGLKHIDSVGLLHRDIKPGNLFVTREGTVKILDLGFARFTDHRHDHLTIQRGSTVLGTIDYMAPEQMELGTELDIRADIYALGATFYFLLTGEPPLPTGNMTTKVFALQLREPRSIKEFRSDMDTGLERIVSRMLAKAPKNRYENPDELIEVLERWRSLHGDTRLNSQKVTTQDYPIPPDLLPAKEPTTPLLSIREEAPRQYGYRWLWGAILAVLLAVSAGVVCERLR